ncbi:MAG TPA: Tex family protein [Anaerolineaceae bacterium]|nr:Tex family protein [Anaerolineaceae bacterium]HOH20784.1 Tex family protein [Anaerolineaceae bacterium]HPA33840.1 Tex family protein [Anaerolineaceae bacterium]
MKTKAQYAQSIASMLGVQTGQISAVIDLLDEGSTIPFIARYRKEKTGSLDEEQLRQAQEAIERLRTLDERRDAILASIEEQGKLTEDLRAQLEAAEMLSTLEDLYQPYRPKRRTRAMIARERGLEGLAEMILKQPRDGTTPEEAARDYLTDEVPSVEDALAGARDIVAETISDHAEVRGQTRLKALQFGVLTAEKIPDSDDPRAVYEVYYAFESRVDRLRPHQVLAMDRGETEKILRVKISVPERDWQIAVLAYFRADTRSPFHPQFILAMQDGADRLLLPAIERDVRRQLTETAQSHAIRVFASNLKALLLQPPLAGQVVLGIDPGFRTGCKVAVVDPQGKLLDTGTIYPHEPQNRLEESLKVLAALVEKYHVTLITIGNGTASRETEALAARLIRSLPHVRYLIVNEAGASVYSASPLARAELPGLDVSLRGAVSIARRAQDPMAELVKIDPKSIGVGMYQHDVDQTQLGKALESVVEEVVNRVGVDLNSASPALLTHISGIGPKLAERIVAYRDEHGVFRKREDLRKVSGLGPKSFEQCAGFLRIRNGDQPLDASAIHPESYPVAARVMDLAGFDFLASMDERQKQITELLSAGSMAELADMVGCGVPTLQDILEQLVRPGRDPRSDLPLPILRSDVLKMEDLVVGLQMKGTIRNVVDFGAFVDIGVKQDGLLHRTQIPAGTVLQPGDIIQVEILKVEIDRGRISLAWVGNA